MAYPCGFNGHFPGWLMILGIFSCAFWPTVCLLLWSVCCEPFVICLIIELQELFVYFGNKPFVRCKYSKYLLPVNFSSPPQILKCFNCALRKSQLFLRKVPCTLNPLTKHALYLLPQQKLGSPPRTVFVFSPSSSGPCASWGEVGTLPPSWFLPLLWHSAPFNLGHQTIPTACLSCLFIY